MSVENKYGGASLCIYFKDATLPQRIEQLAAAINMSTSNLIEAVFESIISDMEEKAPGKRYFNVTLTLKV